MINCGITIKECHNIFSFIENIYIYKHSYSRLSRKNHLFKKQTKDNEKKIKNMKNWVINKANKKILHCFYLICRENDGKINRTSCIILSKLSTFFLWLLLFNIFMCCILHENEKHYIIEHDLKNISRLKIVCRMVNYLT